MTKLAAAKVYRSGRTARAWNHETNRVDLDTEKDSLNLKFSLSSKGGGITEVQIAIGPDDFSALVAAMVSVDRGRATREMAAIVASELAKQPDYDRVTARGARESVVEAASVAYEQAPEGRDHAERLTRDMVRQLVEQLNKLDEAESGDESDAA